VINAVKAGHFKMTMAPLDITTPHTIPFTELIHPAFIPVQEGEPRAPDASTATPLEAFISAMLLRVRGIHAGFGLPDAMEMHDPVSIWYAIENAQRGRNPKDGWVIKPRDFKVERTGELTRGMCVVDRRYVACVLLFPFGRQIHRCVAVSVSAIPRVES
jgi:inosine-uridine nucleoside N-ribohydrolase